MRRLKLKLSTINYKQAVDFILPLHYAGRIPSISYAFGWFDDDLLVAVCTFGKPASNSLCVGVCGSEYKDYVYELNRLVSITDKPLSKFVGGCLRELGNKIIVSYADTGMNHVGKIYQACNFIYTGATKRRTDKYTPGNKHSRHYKDIDYGLRKVRTAKHRYIYFTGDKRFKKKALQSLKYKIESYPKGESERYTLGEYQQVEIIKT